jgi:hypothetical protein
MSKDRSWRYLDSWMFDGHGGRTVSTINNDLRPGMVGTTLSHTLDQISSRCPEFWTVQ